MSNFGEINALIFDVDGTLFDLAPVRRGILYRLLAFGLKHPFEGITTMRMLSAYRKAQEHLRKREASDRNENALALGYAQLQRASAVCGAPVDRVKEAVERWMEREPLDLIPSWRKPGIMDLLDAAKRRGIALAVLSDYPADGKLAALGIRHYFDVVACAQDEDIQRFKPDPAGLTAVLNRLGVPARNAMYVGDRAEVDGICAVRAGVRGVIVGDPGVSPAKDSIHVVNSLRTLASALWPEPQYAATVTERVKFV
jgi:FMN phosphatase YigB (HAD superfamily)